MQQKIKILHLIAPTTLAGAERVIINLIEHIDSIMVETVVCSFVSAKRKKNIFVNELNKKKHKNYIIIMNKTFDLINIAQIVRIIKKEKVDILHTHGYRSDFIGLICSWLTKKPIVSTAHGWTPSTFKLRIYELLDRVVLIFFDSIIAVSSEVEKSLLNAYIPHRKIKLIPNAIGSIDKSINKNFNLRKAINVQRKTKIIGTVARLSREKGLDYLIYAVRDLIKNNYDIILLIVGEGREEKRLKVLSEKIGVKNNVIFYGFEKNISKIYLHLDLFILPSLTEGTPMALLEAMVYGIPVVASKVGEVPNIIRNGYNGVLVEPADYEMLAEKIKYVLTNSEKAIKMGGAAQKTVKANYDVKSWVNKIEGIYRNILLDN